MEDLTKALTEAQTKRITDEAQMRQVRAGDYNSLPKVVVNPAITALKPQVRRLQSQYANMSSASIHDIQNYSAQGGAFAGKQQSEQGDRSVAKANPNMTKTRVTRSTNYALNRLPKRNGILALNDTSLQDAVLAREVETKRELYKNVLLRMQQIQVGEQAPVTNISIVDRAVAPAIPSTPKKRRDMAIGGLLALVCGIVLAFLLDHLDNRLKTSEEVEKYLQLPNLAVAPDFALLDATGGEHRGFDRLRKVLPWFDATAGDTLDTYVHQPAREEVYWSIQDGPDVLPCRCAAKENVNDECDRRRRQNMDRPSYGSRFRTDWCQDAAHRRRYLRHPQCHEMLGVDNSVGLSEVLVGQLEFPDIIHYIEEQRLFFLSAGIRVP